MDTEPNDLSTLLAKNQRSRKYTRDSSIGSAELPCDLISDASVSSLSEHANLHGSVETVTSITSSELDEFNWRRLRFYLVEPMVFILLFAYNLSETIVKNQIIYQTCTSIFFFNESDCGQLGTKNASEHVKQIETTIQPYAARIFMTSSLIESFVPAFCGVFIGAWSDRFGRKPLLITAYSAIIAQLSTNSLVSPWYYLLAVLPLSLIGGSVTYSVATFCYISDVSSAQERPYRMATYEVALIGGLMAGSFISGYLYEATNATYVFLTSCCSIFVANCIILFFIPESLNRRRFQFVYNTVSEEEERVRQLNASADEIGEVRKLFDLAAVKEMWQTCFRPREFNDRAIIWLAMMACSISVFVLDGNMTVFYLFIREIFNWSVKEFTTFETISMFVTTIGNIMGIIVLKRLLKLSIVHIGALAFLSAAAGSCVKAFAVTKWFMYLAVGVSALRAMAHPMCRTIASNVLPPNELGKFFSFYSVLQAFLPFIASPIYAGIYSITLTSFPGFYNLLNANLFIIAICFLLVILRKKRAYPTRYQERL
ncbi:PREDICTED: proton-coupled folate transporter-like isoform X2 [Bactrocera latifrons]|uniref:proton-coupled folate transporter-like isoform X2 n=1 Tax=Bactrocera latifrons TaxID=174628 RepID=UPI0008DD408C|nr:PREDICTED: proton-coupled folate transporter-like isoform X2 [Bactrocera latifrons]